MAGKLSEKDYYSLVERGILVSISFLVFDKEGKVLLGKRKNKPAKDFLFNPGGSISKNESFEQALHRISLNELGFEVNFSDLILNGIYSHNYPDNFFDDKFGTHYVDFAFEYLLGEKEIDEKIFLDQHSSIDWMSKDEILRSDEVHENVKFYFRENAPNKLCCKNI